MARQQEEREDLLREATALVERAEINCGAEAIVAGFRRDGSASVYLSPQEVYQFNSAGELRRAFLDDLLYKAEHGQLVRLTRQRSETSVNLIRHELANEEASQFLFAARRKLAQLAADLNNGHYEVVGEFPVNGRVVARIRRWLDTLPDRILVAAGPGAK